MSGRPKLLAGADLPPEPRQKRSKTTRARLKKAGLGQFGERGYEASSVETIAKRARLAVGTFYQHFHSKRELLLVLMDELIEKLSQLNLRPSEETNKDVRAGLRELLRGAFAQDLLYLGAYRAWQEAMLGDPELARKNEEIHAWTTGRITAVFEALLKMPGARPEVDAPGLARVMDSFFWSLLGRAGKMRPAEIERAVNAATHLIYHGLFVR